MVRTGRKESWKTSHTVGVDGGVDEVRGSSPTPFGHRNRSMFYNSYFVRSNYFVKYVKWTDFFFLNIQSCVVVNGQVSTWFQIGAVDKAIPSPLVYIYGVRTF